MLWSTQERGQPIECPLNDLAMEVLFRTERQKLNTVNIIVGEPSLIFLEAKEPYQFLITKAR